MKFICNIQVYYACQATSELYSKQSPPPPHLFVIFCSLLASCNQFKLLALQGRGIVYSVGKVLCIVILLVYIELISSFPWTL